MLFIAVVVSFRMVPRTKEFLCIMNSKATSLYSNEPLYYSSEQSWTIVNNNEQFRTTLNNSKGMLRSRHFLSIIFLPDIVFAIDHVLRPDSMCLHITWRSRVVSYPHVVRQHSMAKSDIISDISSKPSKVIIHNNNTLITNEHHAALHRYGSFELNNLQRYLGATPLSSKLTCSSALTSLPGER